MAAIDAAAEAIRATQAANDYLQGIVPESEAERNAQRTLRAAMMYMRGAGVKYATAAALPELYAQCAFMLMADWSENLGSTAEGTRSPLPISARQILLQLRYSKENKEASDENQ